MDNSDYSRNRNNEYLGVNKIGKNIRKSPLHQPNFANPARQQPQPQVYNINKNDFQSIVQQLTGSPSRQSQEPLPRPPVNSPKPTSTRLQRIRPSPLTPLNVTRPRLPIHHAPPPPQEHMVPHQGQTRSLQNGAVPFNGSNLGRPPLHVHQRPPPPMAGPPMNSGDHPGYMNIAESPISQYMRYLQHSITDSAQGHPPPHSQGHPPPHPQGHPPPHPQGHPPPPQQGHTQYQQNPQGQSQMQGQQYQQHLSSGLVPYPLPSPRMNGGPPPLPSPRMNGGPPLPPLPSPRTNGGPPPALPSPTSQFLLPSPSGYLNLSSPRSPYPLLSPGYQHPPPLTPNFSFSPMTQPGSFNPGLQPPPSPGMNFPSPGFFSMLSPRWRD
ncbi:protein HAIKU1-like [Rutidosis leptorrhynchoides]|uniref:protein HAIKU1-like n=1 Tax=Rutidosis leptorrhynchoides TaxID=125765 RepID=UPI003A98DBF5